MGKTRRWFGVWGAGWLAVLLAGCGEDRPNGAPSPRPDGAFTESRTALTSGGWGTVKGRVTFAGDPPPAKPIDVKGSLHESHCKFPDLVDETWVVDPESKGVANVVVWLRPPEGTFFPRPPDERRTWPEKVVIEQPHCAFRPHVAVLYPEYYEPSVRRLVPTGQDLVVTNSAAIPHEARFQGSPGRNPERNTILPGRKPGGEPAAATFRLKSDDRPITLRCSLHPWMSAYVWAFDHPYAAVTDADGNFEIRNAPAGAELRLRAWHEAGEVSLPKGGEKVTVPADGVLTKDFTVRVSGQ